MSDPVPLLGERPPVTANDVIEIKFALIRIEERMTASAEAAEHRHANIKQSLDNFVPRRELDQIFAGITARFTSLDADVASRAKDGTVADIGRRVGKIEDAQAWVIRTVALIVIGAVASAVTFAVKHG